MAYNPRNAVAFFGPVGLGEFIASVVSVWKLGRDAVFIWHLEDSHDGADCECPKLIFTQETLSIPCVNPEQGGPQE